MARIQGKIIEIKEFLREAIQAKTSRRNRFSFFIF